MTQCKMLQNHVWVKKSIQSANQAMDFNITEIEKFIDSVSDFTLQVTFKKLPLRVLLQ